LLIEAKGGEKRAKLGIIIAKEDNKYIMKYCSYKREYLIKRLF